MFVNFPEIYESMLWKKKLINIVTALSQIFMFNINV